MKITQVKTELLCQHPDNPRQEYGDITELTESIKEQGVLEPLIVVQIGTGRHYNVVAGNRRLKAAKEAGLKELPCIISEMSEKEQAAVMLTENMARKNLTPYEECKGVQMCLNLGMTEEDLSKKTGFSKTTIHHRKKMSELDQEILKKKCQDGQITMQEILALEKVKDPARRNEVLEAAGTNNFNYKLTQTLNFEELMEEKEKVFKILNSFANEECTGWFDNTYYQVCYHVKPDFEIPDDTDEVMYSFKEPYQGCGFYALYKKRPDVDEEAEDPEESEYETNRRKQDIAKAKLKELGETFFEMRKKHMQNTDTFKGNILQWLAYVIVGDEFDEENEHPEGFPWNAMVSGYGAHDLYHEVMESRDNFTAEEIVKDMRFDSIQRPIASPTLVYSILETKGRIACATWQGEFDENDEEYERLYAFMELCGYQISDEEQKILEGTHEAYFSKEDK